VSKIASAVLRHRRIVVLAWIGLTVAGALTVNQATGRMTYSYTTPGQAGYEANLHLTQRFGIDGTQEPALAVLHLPPGQTMRSAAARTEAAKEFAAASRPGVAIVADYADTHNRKLISRDGRMTWAVINLANPDTGPGQGAGADLEPAMRAAAPAGSSVTVTGFGQLLTASGSSGGPGVLVETLIGAVGALLVLLFVYGSAIAVVPLLMALPVILTTFLCLLGLTYLGGVSYFLQYLAAFVGLGVAVDYSLLVVVRWREERERGLGNEAAIAAATAHAGRAVLLSGATVAIGLLSLLFLPVPFLNSIGLGGMAIPLVAIAAAVTLLPVTLAAWGPALDRRRLRRSSGTYSGVWERWGRAIVRRRWLAGLGGAAIIVALTVPAFSINTAEPLTSSLAGGGSAGVAFHELQGQGVPDAVVFPIQVLTHGGTTGLRDAGRIIARTPGVYTELAPDTPSFRTRGDGLITVIPVAQGATSQGKATVTNLRSRLARAGVDAEVAGSTAADLAFTHAVYGNLPLILILIGVITFLVLARAFRSVLLALKAVLLNLLSLGASFGFMVLFWQEGHGSKLIYGVSATSAIRDWIPIVLFAALFGLSMDYEVFMLARLREEYDRCGDTDAAIVSALARTGRLVTSAALILAISFLSLSSTPNEILRIIGTALAFGILVDAVVIRTLLVPAFVSLMGRWNWWMPSAVARMLGLRVPVAAVSTDDP
jgi:putative drug exporter of the RND superfamily